MFILKGTDGSNSTFDPLNNSTLQDWDVPDALPDDSYDNIANSMGITREELDELITTPLDLTPEQEAAIEEILDSYRPPDIAEFTEDANPNDNIFPYIDTDGNTGEMEINIPDLTEDELDQYYADMDAFLEKLENGEIDFENDMPPQLGDYYNDPNIGTGDYDEMRNDGENYIGIGEGGFMGDPDDEEEATENTYENMHLIS